MITVTQESANKAQQAALDAYWAAKTPDEEREAVRRMTVLGMIARKEYRLERGLGEGAVRVAIYEIKDDQRVRCVAVLSGEADADMEEAMKMAAALNATV